MPRHRPLVDLMLALVDEAFDHKAWHGTTLLGSIRGMSASQAAWRPAPRRHNVWEVVVHAAYWKYAVRRRLTGEGRGSFSLKGSNWFARPTDDRSWPDDVALLLEEHRRLRSAIRRLPDAALRATSRRRTGSPAYLVRGIAAHDLYHAGQIQLLKRLSAQKRRARDV